jgi:hypothetical protein
MDSGGVGVGATLQCLLLAWDRGGAKEDEAAIVVRTSDLTQIIRGIVHSKPILIGVYGSKCG